MVLKALFTKPARSIDSVNCADQLQSGVFSLIFRNFGGSWPTKLLDAYVSLMCGD